MKAALQIYSRDFDADFFKLPLAIQRRLEGQIDRLGLMLDRFSHTHLKGMDCYRLRVGDYMASAWQRMQSVFGWQEKLGAGRILWYG